MTAIHFVTRHADGTTETRDVQAPAGKSVMQAAVAAGIDAIAADCGGLLTCATCHVYVAPEWAGKLPAPSADELGMLEFTAAPRRETSRLSCQIQVGPEIEGLTVELPDRQY
jgi:2Fe-2S ferredoxin